VHDHADPQGRRVVRRDAAARVDPATILPSAFIVDARDRGRSGIRISLPPRAAAARGLAR
jgi:hypothetical protein